MRTAATDRRTRHGLRGCSLPFLLALAALVALGPAAAPGAEAEASLELSVKAAYLYNFTRFVTWPADSPLGAEAVFSIGVLDDEALADAVEANVRAKTVGARSVAVRRFRNAGEVVPCPVLYVGRAHSESLPLLEAKLRGWPVLTVSDAAGFVRRGGVIALYVQDRRIRFEVQAAAARAAGLAVSSKLLRLSRPSPCPSCSPRSGEER